MSRKRGCRLGNVFRCAARDDFTAAVATLRPQIDDPISRLDDIEIVLDHDDGVALVAQSMENCQQVFDVLEMQAGGRFI